MKSKRMNKPSNHSLFCFLFIIATTVVQAQFQIVGMQYNGVFATGGVNLTILNPDGTHFTGLIPYDANRQYQSGTTFKTPAGTSISIMYKGQTQVMSPNSSLKVSVVKNGVKAQTLTGKVRHVLKDVKSKLGFYKAGNGYTWAHAEGTDFYVEAYDKSKKAKFSMEEGRIAIIEEVPISINEAAKNQTQRKGQAANRELKTTKRIYKTAGEEYVTNEVTPIYYASYEDALYAFDDEIYAKEAQGVAYVEELADDFMLLGELYLDNDQMLDAIDPLRKAVYYNYEADPESPTTLEAVLYLSEALIYSNNNVYENEGYEYINTVITALKEELNIYTSDYNYALNEGDYDLAWEIGSDLVLINEYLGWSFELGGDLNGAMYYYDLSDQYASQL